MSKSNPSDRKQGKRPHEVVFKPSRTIRKLTKFVPVNPDKWGGWVLTSRHEDGPDNHVRVRLVDNAISRNPKFWYVGVSISDYDDCYIGKQIRIARDRSNYDDAKAEMEALYDSIQDGVVLKELLGDGWHF